MNDERRPALPQSSAKPDEGPSSSRGGRDGAAAATVGDSTRRPSRRPLIVLFAFIALTFAPTLIGRMSDVGPVAQLDRPELHVMGEALQSGRLPAWSGQLDFGRPLLAEGQIGAYYPPHWMLFTWLSPWNATIATLILHALIATTGAYYCGRSFGLSRSGAVLTALCFVGQGELILLHSRVWAWTSVSWFPWVVAFTWSIVMRNRHTLVTPLAFVLALQLTAGHFQFAWMTSVVIAAIVVYALAARRKEPTLSEEGVSPRSVLLSVPLVGVAFVVGVTCAACQLIPSAELFLIGDHRGRDGALASSFVFPPFAATELVLPMVFQSHALWQDALWSPHRSSPAHCLPYFGILPLCLAIYAVKNVWHSDRHRDTVRLMTLLCALSLWLSLGSDGPGLSWMGAADGWSWFVAPARWHLVTGLAVGLLAGCSLSNESQERLLDRLRRIVLGVVGLAVLGVGVVLAMHWKSDAFRNHVDVSLSWQLIAEGETAASISQLAPVERVGRMLAVESVYPALNIVVVIGVLTVLRRRPPARGWSDVLILLAGLDLLTASYLLGPPTVAADTEALVEAVAAERPTRVAGRAGYRPVVGGTPSIGSRAHPEIASVWNVGERQVDDYFLDVATTPPAARVGDIGARLARRAHFLEADDVVIMQLMGIELLVCGLEGGVPSRAPLRQIERVEDGRVGALLLGESPEEFIVTRPWTLWRLEPGRVVSRAWFFDGGDDEPGRDPRRLLRPPPARRQPFDYAYPARIEVETDDLVVVRGTADEPGVLFLADLHYPGWKATVTQNATSVAVPISKGFGDWRAVEIAEAGTFEVEFRFESAAIAAGQWVSGIGLFGLVLLAILTLLRRRPRIVV